MKKANTSFYKISLVLLCITFSFVILNCKKSQLCEPVTVSEDNNVLPSPRNNFELDIFLDATLSMQGFITENNYSYYRQTLPLLESAAIGGSRASKVNYYKFGSVIETIVERNQLEADKKSFYSDSKYNSKTLIENVIDRADTNHLTVLLTDLFQNNADINQLSEKIKNKFILNNFAVGILAVKSQYNGRVYDVGTNNYSFGYTSTSDPVTFRPFYIIIFGPHADIAAYFDSLEEAGLSKFPVKEKIIFSKYLTDSPSSLKDAKINETESLNEVTGVIVKSQQEDSAFKEFRVKNKESAYLTAEIPFSKLPNTIDIGKDFEIIVDSSNCRSSTSANNNPERSFVLDTDLKSAVNISSITANEKSLQLRIDIQPGKLNENTTDAFHILIQPKQSVLPKWIEEWTMNANQIEYWKNNPAEFDGTKTYNFNLFLSTLAKATKDVHQSKIADFYCYFKRS